MEVLGAISASVSLLDVTVGGVHKTVQTLKRLKKAPPEFQALLDQVEAIIIVVKAVSDTVPASDVPDGIVSLLERLKGQLQELEQLISTTQAYQARTG